MKRTGSGRALFLLLIPNRTQASVQEQYSLPRGQEALPDILWKPKSPAPCRLMSPRK